MMGFDFSQVVFSDEKIWRIRPGGRVRVFRRRGDRYNPKYTVKTVSKSVGVMVWCAINGRGDVLVRRCPEKVDAEAYQGILKSALTFIRPRCVLANLLFWSHSCVSSSELPRRGCTSSRMVLHPILRGQLKAGWRRTR